MGTQTVVLVVPVGVAARAGIRIRGVGEELEEWVRRDDDMIRQGDRVLFLGFPGSFAVEAARFGGEVNGGSAYFVVASAGHGCSSSAGAPPLEPSSVYRFSFRDGSTTLVETLPPRWHDARCMWFLPQPGISPISAPATTDQQEAPATCSRTRR
ncbi:hypothetical protein ACP70R_038657 [Stipagrostis hirtigluma subsp. patula]